MKPSVFESKKKLFLAALLVANADERVALGISYGRGYSRTIQSIHPLIGSHDYGRDDNDTKHIKNFSYLSIICMHIMHLAYKLADINNPEDITRIMGENFERSEASKNIAKFRKELEVGDLVLTVWTDLAEIVEGHTSKYGYKAYKIKYLLQPPPLPEFPEDWIESSNILARRMTKSWVRSFFEKNTSVDKMPQEVKDIWPEVIKKSDKADSLKSTRSRSCNSKVSQKIHHPKRGHSGRGVWENSAVFLQKIEASPASLLC